MSPQFWFRMRNYGFSPHFSAKPSRLLEIVKEQSPSWLGPEKDLQTKGRYWNRKANAPIRAALETYAYQARHSHSGFRECTAEARTWAGTS